MLLVVWMMACTNADTSITTTPQPTEALQATETLQVTDTPTPTLTLTPEATPTPEGLSADPPWLITGLMEQADGYLAVLNDDASAMKVLVESEEVIAFDVVYDAMGTPHLLYIAGDPYGLYEVELPNGTPTLITEVITADAMDYTRFFISSVRSERFVVSPDGRYLAFSAAIDSPDTDLYLYDAHTESITRLHADPDSQIQTVAWAPDGQAVVHVNYVHRITDIDGISLYSTMLDGTQSVMLPSPENITTEDTIVYGVRFYGWLSATDLVLASYADDQNVNLRQIDITTGEATLLYEDPFSSGILVDGVFYRATLPNNEGHTILRQNLETGEETVIGSSSIVLGLPQTMANTGTQAAWGNFDYLWYLSANDAEDRQGNKLNGRRIDASEPKG
jgi:hypothetical protein